jgi:hypothetical protein
MNGVLQANMVETLLGLVVLVAWVIINFAAARKRQGPRPGGGQTERAPPPPVARPVRPRPSTRSPEEELQEFLERLAGGTPVPRSPEGVMETEPPPPARPDRPPTYVSPVPPRPAFPGRPAPMPAARSAPARTRDRRPKVRPPALPRVPAAPATTPMAAAVADLPPPPPPPRVSVASFRMPGVHMPAMRVVGALPSMAAGALGGDLRRGAPYELNIRDRDRLRRAVLMQAILAPPPGLS